MSINYITYILTGFVGGVAIRSFVDIGGTFAGLFLLDGLIFLSLRRRYVGFAAIGIIFLGIAAGVVRYDIYNSRHNAQAYVFDDVHVIEFEAVVREEPQRTENAIKLVLEPTGTHARVIVYAAPLPEYAYGDLVRVRGKSAALPRISLVSHDMGSRVIAWLIEVKRGFVSNIDRVLPEPNAALTSGIAIGAQDSLGKELTQDFRTAGISHIVVLSGYNMTIVARGIMNFLSLLPPWVGAGAGTLGVILFTLMTGAGASTVRAAIMSILMLLARPLRRTYDVSRALVAAGAVMIFLDPTILVFDLSFQLSFLASLGLVFGVPYLEQYTTRIPEKFKLRESLNTTLAAQFAVLPLLLFKIGDLSLVALPVNILVLPLIPAIMALGSLTGLFGFMFDGLALLSAYVTYALTAYVLAVVRAGVAVPHASVLIPYFPWWLMVACYAGYAILIVRWQRSNGMEKEL